MVVVIYKITIFFSLSLYIIFRLDLTITISFGRFVKDPYRLQTTLVFLKNAFYKSYRMPCDSDESRTSATRSDTCESRVPSPESSVFLFSDRDLNSMARFVRKFLGGSLEWYHFAYRRISLFGRSSPVLALKPKNVLN